MDNTVNGVAPNIRAAVSKITRDLWNISGVFFRIKASPHCTSVSK
ncbi:MAG: hypothetical protein ACREYE_05190 [Gammaproteobacteria bacterium]